MKLFNRKSYGTTKAEQMSKDKDTLLNTKLFEAYKSEPGRNRWGKNSADDIAMWNGAIFTASDAQSLEARNAPVPSMNVLKQPIGLLISQLTHNKPRFTATARENSDTSLAGSVSDTFLYIWDVSDGNEKLKISIEDFEVTGIGALLTYIDPNADNGKGEIKIVDIDPQDIFIDPNSKRSDSSDASHILIVQKYSKGQIKENYPSFNFDGASDTTNEHHEKHTRFEQVDQSTDYQNYSELLDGDDDKKYDVIDRYSKIKVKHFHVFDPITDFEKILTKDEFKGFLKKVAIISIVDGEPTYATKQTDVREALKIIEGVNKLSNLPPSNSASYMIDPQTNSPIPPSNNEDGTPVGQLVELKSVQFKELLENDVIKLNEVNLTRIKRVLTIGEKAFFKDTMPISEYPIVTFMLHHNRNPYAYGDVRMTKTILEQLNKSESLIMEHAQQTANVKVFLPEGGTNPKELKERWNAPGTQYFYYNADDNKGGVHMVSPNPLSNEFYMQRQNYISEIQNEIGAFSFQDGDASQAPPTARGTLLLDEMGQRRSRLKRDTVEHTLNQIAKVIMQLIPYVYTERKVIRITEPNHKSKEIILNDYNGIEITNDVSNWEYDIKVVSGSMLPSNRWARFDSYMDMWDRDILNDNVPIIRESEFPNTDEMIENEGTINQLKRALGQAQEEIKKLGGDMQTADRELRTADRRVADAKYQSTVKGQQSKLESSVNLATARVNDEVKTIKNNMSTKTEEKK